MKRKDYLTTIIGTLIIVLVIGILFGYCCAKVYGAEVSVVNSMAGGERAKIEGGGMPCMDSVAPEKPSFTAETEEAEEVIIETPKRSVNGESMSADLQTYLYNQLASRGVAYFYDTACLQIYQESRYNIYAKNPNGLDMGLCQFRITYWDKFARESGLVQYDIWNPIDQLYVYAYLMAKYINEEGSVDMALSRYYTGQSNFNQSYVTAVRQWERTLK